MNPKQFLTIGGVILILIAILGWVNVIGPTADDSVFGEAWYFDMAENWAHLVLGVVALIAAFLFPATVNKPLVMLLGIIGILIGIYSVFGPVTEGKAFLDAQLQNPGDSILHIVVGVWALWASMAKPKTMMSSQGGMQV